MTHALKTWPEYYKQVVSGDKPFEIRKNTDRDFKVGDLLLLQEWDPETGKYTGQQDYFSVTSKIDGPAFGLKKGYSIMGITEHRND